MALRGLQRTSRRRRCEDAVSCRSDASAPSSMRQRLRSICHRSHADGAAPGHSGGGGGGTGSGEATTSASRREAAATRLARRPLALGRRLSCVRVISRAQAGRSEAMRLWRGRHIRWAQNGDVWRPFAARTSGPAGKAHRWFVRADAGCRTVRVAYICFERAKSFRDLSRFGRAGRMPIVWLPARKPP